MPTVVRLMSKLALFVLVIAVSGIGATQAQTDPTPTPTPSSDVGPYGDIVKYDRQESANLETEELIVNVTWLFYGVEGYSDRFFVVADSSATIRDHTSRPLSSITSFSVSIDSWTGNTSLVRWEPAAFTVLSEENPDIDLGVQVGGVKTGVKIPLGFTEGVVQPYPLSGGRGGVDGGDEYSLQWMGQSWDKTVGVQFVTYWEGDLRNIDVDFCGTYKETPVSDEYQWGNCGSGGT